jgi:hypothetical protein
MVLAGALKPTKNPGCATRPTPTRAQRVAHPELEVGAGEAEQPVHAVLQHSRDLVGVYFHAKSSFVDINLKSVFGDLFRLPWRFRNRGVPGNWLSGVFQSKSLVLSFRPNRSLKFVPARRDLWLEAS